MIKFCTFKGLATCKNDQNIFVSSIYLIDSKDLKFHIKKNNEYFSRSIVKIDS